MQVASEPRVSPISVELMGCVVLLLALPFAASRAAQKLDAVSPPTRSVAAAQGGNNARAVLKRLWPALGYGETAGRIYYSAVCRRPNESFDASFPRLDVEPPPQGKLGIAAVRDMFRHDKDVSVKETAPGIVRIRIGSVPDDILRVRIPSLALTADERYNYWLAISKIQNAPEVRSAMHKLGISTPLRFINVLIGNVPEWPHLPSVMTNVTVDEALDLVAKTFRGVVVYEFCASRDQYEFYFVDASYIYATRD
jgi:hypothetical protein